MSWLPLRALLVGWVLAVLTPSSALAHEFHPGVLALKETSPGTFVARWSPPLSGRATEATTLRFPSHCKQKPGFVLECGARGLLGQVSVSGSSESAVHVSVTWTSGATSNHLLRVGTPLEFYGSSMKADRRAQLTVLLDYSVLGGVHILEGVDHLLFVLGLMLVVGTTRCLAFSITAFTIAHSITLGGAALSGWALPAGPVEVVIALSVLLMAHEATLPQTTWTHRFPWIVAFSFGLVHGFGFAGALGELGLPPHQAWAALLSFNVGVELAQLGVIFLLLFAARLVRGHAAVRRHARTALVYGVGSYAATLTFQRIFQLLFDLQ